MTINRIQDGIIMNRIYTCFPEGKAKVLTFSYDDGKEEDKRLIDIFNANGLKGTFNLNYSHLHNVDYSQKHVRIPEKEILDVYKGHEIATHTLTHPTIERCPLTEVAYEILEDRKGLESIVGAPVRGCAYPNGSYSAEIMALFKQLGIAYARVVETDPTFNLPNEPMAWKGTARHRDPKLMEYADFFVNFNKKQYLKCFYVWGHSYEFEDDNNWDVIEKFAEKVGGKDDIWYATNIDIIDYMAATERLIFAADNSFVYNPNACPVWLDVNNKVYEIRGGELARF